MNVVGGEGGGAGYGQKTYVYQEIMFVFAPLKKKKNDKNRQTLWSSGFDPVSWLVVGSGFDPVSLLVIGSGFDTVSLLVIGSGFDPVSWLVVGSGREK
jgi:hypothetical protein